jgi:hypothetical protein
MQGSVERSSRVSVKRNKPAVDDLEIVADKPFGTTVRPNDLTVAIEHNHCRPAHLKCLHRRVDAGSSESSRKLGAPREVP